jgi:hypothetical protein
MRLERSSTATSLDLNGVPLKERFFLGDVDFFGR